jgi:hypothetical protein
LSKNETFGKQKDFRKFEVCFPQGIRNKEN